MFTKNPISIENDIFDFLGETNNEYLKSFDELANDKKGNVTLETEIFKNLCEMLVSKKGKVVDIGCGEGYILNGLTGYRVGVDSSKLRLGCLDNDIIKVRANVENLPFQDEYFDTAICTDVFEHVENEKMLADELYRILTPKGILFLAVPWKQDLSVYKLPEFKKRWKSYICRHRRSVNRDMIVKNFKKFRIQNETMIITAARFMKYTPYSIKFMQFIKK